MALKIANSNHSRTPADEGSGYRCSYLRREWLKGGDGPVHRGDLVEEQKQAIADQQARALEYMQNAQKYAAEFYASQRAPMLDMQTVMEEREARFKEIDAEREASRQAYEARVAESKAAYEARRKEREAALKARMERHNRKPAADTGA